jgi:hypothetical protein
MNESVCGSLSGVCVYVLVSHFGALSFFLLSLYLCAATTRHDNLPFPSRDKTTSSINRSMMTTPQKKRAAAAKEVPRTVRPLSSNNSRKKRMPRMRAQPSVIPVPIWVTASAPVVKSLTTNLPVRMTLMICRPTMTASHRH